MNTMRTFINLVESVDWLRTNPIYMADSVQRWAHRASFGDGDGGSTVTADDIATAQKRFIGLGPQFEIYRAVVVRPGALEYGSAIGYCWTLNPKYAVPFNHSGNRHRTQTLTFTATIQAAGVDWLASIALANGGEDEIRLKDHAPVHVTRIVDDFGEPVREELWNTDFRSGPAI